MTPNAHLFGWCSPLDTYHKACRYQYVGGNGVTYTCSCPNHTQEDAA